MRKAGPDMLQGIGNHLHDAGAPTRLVFCKDNMRLSKQLRRQTTEHTALVSCRGCGSATARRVGDGCGSRCACRSVLSVLFVHSTDTNPPSTKKLKPVCCKLKWPRTPPCRVSCECACTTLEAAGLWVHGQERRCTEYTVCRSAHGPCHKTADKFCRVVCIMSALSFRGFRPDMNFDHCAKRGRGGCMLIVIICERAVTPLPLACVGARRIAIAWFDAIVVWHKPLQNVLASSRASSTRSARRQRRAAQKTRRDGRMTGACRHLLCDDVKLETSLICHQNLQDLRLGVHRVIGGRLFPTTDGGPHVAHDGRSFLIYCIGNIVVVKVVTPECVAAFAIQPFALFEELVCYGVCRIGFEPRGTFLEVLHRGKSADKAVGLGSRSVQSNSLSQRCEREEGSWGDGVGDTPWIFGLLTFVPVWVNRRLVHMLGEPGHLVSPDVFV